MAIHTLSIGLETFSDVDLKKCGVYKYASSPNFEILLFGVSVDGGEVTVYDLASGDTVPEEIIRALSDDSVIKWAYNASFERVCLSVWLRRNYPQYFSLYVFYCKFKLFTVCFYFAVFSAPYHRTFVYNPVSDKFRFMSNLNYFQTMTSMKCPFSYPLHTFWNFHGFQIVKF